MIYHAELKHAMMQTKKRLTKYKKMMIAGIASVGVVVALPLAASAATPSTVYNATPSTLPPNVASLGYEATSTTEFGDHITLGGSDRKLNTVTATMSDWAVHSDYLSDSRYSTTSSTWTHPITVKVYSTHLGAGGVPDTLLASKTQTITIPWRQAADPSCSDSRWKASDGNCYGGVAFNATFDLSSLNVALPSDVIVSISYNTADYGTNPIHAAGPYNSLNVGVPVHQPVSVGIDASTDKVFWNTSFAGFYADNGVAGVGTFREDTGWGAAGNGTVALKVTATPYTAGIPTSLLQCLNDGWKSFASPSFKNAGECVAWVNAGATGNIKINSTKKLVFNVANRNDFLTNLFGNKVEYTDNDYQGGLHYSANVTCTYVDPQTNEARFLFQIPAGHGSLSGVYVVSYVKEVKNGTDQYAQNATTDLATATQWCKTGVGFNPAFYTVTKGSVNVF